MRFSNTKGLVVAGVIVVGLVLPLRSSTTSAPAEADDRVQVIFAPRSDCTAALVKAIRAAQKTLKIQMNDLASDVVARELAAARDRGVFVRVLLGSNASPEISAAARPLLEKDHLVRVDTLRYSPHHVTIIVDDALVLTGIVQTLAEDAPPVDQHVMLIKRSPEFTERYVRHWTQRAEKSRLFHEIALGASQRDSDPAAAPPPSSPPRRDAASDDGDAGQMVYVTSSGQRYHSKTCRYAQYGQPVSLQDARARAMTPCKVCKPDAP